MSLKSPLKTKRASLHRLEVFARLSSKKAAQIGNSLRVTIPKELAQHLNLKKGDILTMWADNSHLILDREKKT